MSNRTLGKALFPPPVFKTEIDGKKFALSFFTSANKPIDPIGGQRLVTVLHASALAALKYPSTDRLARAAEIKRLEEEGDFNDREARFALYEIQDIEERDKQRKKLEIQQEQRIERLKLESRKLSRDFEDENRKRAAFVKAYLAKHGTMEMGVIEHPSIGKKTVQELAAVKPIKLRKVKCCRHCGGEL